MRGRKAERDRDTKMASELARAMAPGRETERAIARAWFRARTAGIEQGEDTGARGAMRMILRNVYPLTLASHESSLYQFGRNTKSMVAGWCTASPPKPCLKRVIPDQAEA